MISAVITADIVNSTKLVANSRDKLLNLLKEELSTEKHEFYRGDSFQIYVPDAEKALQLILTLRLTAKSVIEDNKPQTDIRAGIGIGDVEEPVESLGVANGEAFVYSGRSFEQLTQNKHLSIKSRSSEVNITFDVIADFIDDILKDITSKQAEVVKLLIRNQTQTQIAREMNKSQATVAQQVKAANWNAVQKLLTTYNQCIDILRNEN